VTKSITVEESFDITGRGVGAVFRGSADGLPLGQRLRAQVTRADGSQLETHATVELLLVSATQGIERPALLVEGLTKRDLPPGSSVTLFL